MSVRIQDAHADQRRVRGDTRGGEGATGSDDACHVRAVTGGIALGRVRRIDQVDACLDATAKGSSVVGDASVQDGYGDTLASVASLPGVCRSNALLKHDGCWTACRQLGRSRGGADRSVIVDAGNRWVARESSDLGWRQLGDGRAEQVRAGDDLPAGGADDIFGALGSPGWGRVR